MKIINNTIVCNYGKNQELQMPGIFSDEKYELNWIGKRYAKLLAVSPHTTTLKEDTIHNNKPENINSENILIKGDNLEVLKLLLNKYHEKIKVIYIDPPYNTGKNFIYNDTKMYTLQELQRVLEVDETHAKQILNFTNANGNKHSAWLTFMYPRLYLAHQLLRKDGVIFISIDDNEQANLKLLCDEIFGEKNFLANMIRQVKAGSGNNSKGLAIEHDYIICYAKNALTTKLNKEIVDAENDEKYKLEDEFVKDRGKFYLRNLDYKGFYRQSLDYPIILPNGKEIWAGGKQGPPNYWRWSKKKFEWGLENKFIVFKEDKVYIKQYQFVDNEGNKRNRCLPYKSLIKFLNSEGTQDLSSLGLNDIFIFPKSVNMIKYLLKIAANPSGLILDFFAGSGTTGHAVMQLNAEDNGTRKFILVQIDEPIKENTPAYKFCMENNLPPVISSITIERLKRAGEKIKKEIEKNNSKAGMFEEHKKQIPDIGFKVFDTADAPKM